MEKETKLKITDRQIALRKAQDYCAYQERSQQELRDKLYFWGLWPEAVESIISDLISENFLNEERFAIAYAGGKFRIKKWGKIKIRAGLKSKRVSEYCINKAIEAIPDADYRETLAHIIDAKKRKLNEKNKIKLKFKLLQYAYSKGFEQELTLEILSNNGDES